jgi:hypothetical protein
VVSSGRGHVSVQWPGRTLGVAMRVLKQEISKRQDALAAPQGGQGSSQELPLTDSSFCITSTLPLEFPWFGLARERPGPPSGDTWMPAPRGEGRGCCGNGQNGATSMHDARPRLGALQNHLTSGRVRPPFVHFLPRPAAGTCRACGRPGKFSSLGPGAPGAAVLFVDFVRFLAGHGQPGVDSSEMAS